jgi:hypothetical protein
MAETVYVLCAAASIACAWLLLRGYLAGRSKLLLWSTLCFTGLALNNVLTVVDLVFVPQTDLGLWRSAIALASEMLMVYGLILQTS